MSDYVVAVRKLIAATGLEIVDLAIAIDASEKSIYKWMNGTSLPDCRHLLALISLVESRRSET